jgi:hypothetical protein
LVRKAGDQIDVDVVIGGTQPGMSSKPWIACSAHGGGLDIDE